MKGKFIFINFLFLLTASLMLVHSVSAQTYDTYQLQEDSIPIIGYHKVLNCSEEAIDSPTGEICSNDFDSQINHLKNTIGCNFITMEQLATYYSSEEKVPDNACILTFDDGSFYEYENAKPILEKYGAVATFYIIAGRIGTGTTSLREGSYYMTEEEISELLEYGHSIGSHSWNVSAGLNTEGHDLTSLEYQLNYSKSYLESTFNTVVRTFAYPLGEWNQTHINLLKQYGYVLGRDTSKDNTWRDMRPCVLYVEGIDIRSDATTGNSNSDVNNYGPFHLFYYKPELKTLGELTDELSYNGWFQFEENYAVTNLPGGESVLIGSSYRPTDTSYAVMLISGTDAEFTTSFKVVNSGNFSIEILGYTGYGADEVATPYLRMDRTDVYVDGLLIQQYAGNSTVNNGCYNLSNWYYCDYYVDAELEAGVHNMSIRSASSSVRVDKFRVTSDTSQSVSYTNLFTIPVVEEIIEEVVEEVGNKITVTDGIEGVKTTTFAGFALLSVALLVVVSFMIVKILEGGTDAFSLIAVTVLLIGTTIVLLVGYITISSVANGLV